MLFLAPPTDLEFSYPPCEVPPGQATAPWNEPAC